MRSIGKDLAVSTDLMLSCALLQVLEMFSSEGDLHLELPSGERDATQDLWVRCLVHASV